MAENTFRNVVLPLASVLETIATSQASKGRNVGTSAIQAIKGLDEQKRLDEEQRQKAIERAAQGEDRLLNRQVKQAQLGQIQRGQEQEQSAIDEILGAHIEGKIDLTPAELAGVRGGFTKDIIKSRIPRQETEMDILKQILAGEKLKDIQKTPEQRAKEETDEATRKAKLDRDLALQFPKPTTPKPPKEIGEGTLKELAATSASVKQLDDMMQGASKLGLWFNPADKVRALNPWDVDAQSFQQHVAATKQVIGKGLEGGVLRKEDEVKYEKIIPNLGDRKDVLVNKANQLRDMLVQKYKSNVQFLQAGERNVSGLPTIPDKTITFGESPERNELIKKAKEGDKKAQKYLNSQGVKWQQ